MLQNEERKSNINARQICTIPGTSYQHIKNATDFAVVDGCSVHLRWHHFASHIRM